MSGSTSAPASPVGDWLRRAVAHHQQGDLVAASELYDRVLAHDPEQPDALHLLGLLAHQTGDSARGVELIGRSIARDPRAPEFHRSFAAASIGVGDREGAKHALTIALDLRPEDGEASFHLGALHLDDGDPAAAEPYLRAAATLLPGSADAELYLGVALRELEAWSDAEAHLLAATRLAPDYASAWLALGDLLTDLERYDEAERAYRHGIGLAPDSAEAHSNLGRLLEKAGCLDESVKAHERALALAPDLAGAHWSYGIALLRQGRLAEGWREAAWRWRAPGFVAARYELGRPEWQGEPLQGRSILVWGEQGVGDEIMFASCVPDLCATGARVVLACDGRLASLFKRSFPGVEVVSLALLDEGAAPATDFHLPAGDLPRFFRPTLESFPESAGYLRPAAALSAEWRERIGGLGPGLKVGISWRSQYMTASRARSYTTLDEWQPILRVPGVRFVNLQYDDCALALATAEDWGARVEAWPELDLRNDFERVAALMAALDLVISVPNSVGELAGALGRPTWRLHRAGGTWTMLGTDRRPWFPSMRVFEAESGADELMGRVAGALTTVKSET